MPRTRQCSFCGFEFHQGTGIMYVRDDGSILWFCSGKCRKSAIKMKRDPRKLKWTKYYKKEGKAA